MKKRGLNKTAQSQIITTILLIILVLAAIIIVWAVVNNLITESAEGIGTSALTTQLDIKEATLYVTGGAKVRVKREVGEGEITSLKFIFYNKDGESVIIEETENIPKEIETKIYDFGVDEYPELYNINKVSVVPMFGEKSGMEFSETKPNTDVAVSELVSWWKFDENARDSVGGNHGTANGGVDLNYDDEVRGKVASFDGVDDYVDCGNLGIGGINTRGVWFRTDALSGNHYILDMGGNNYWIQLYDHDSDGKLEISAGAGSTTYVNGNYEITDSTQWYYVAVVMDSSNTLTIYVNGNYDNSSSKTLGTPGALYIGRYSGTGNFYFNGSLDDVMIFNKALTENEITAIYNNQKK